jgi:hypothetical protein
MVKVAYKPGSWMKGDGGVGMVLASVASVSHLLFSNASGEAVSS